MTSNSLRKPIQTALVPYRKRTQLPALTPGDLGNLDAYIKAANSAPVLTAEEERNLAIRMRDYNDVDAAQALMRQQDIQLYQPYRLPCSQQDEGTLL